MLVPFERCARDVKGVTYRFKGKYRFGRVHTVLEEPFLSGFYGLTSFYRGPEDFLISGVQTATATSCLLGFL